MAIVSGAALFDPDKESAYVTRKSTELSALWRSGVVVTDAKLQALLNSDGNRYTVPFRNSIVGTPMEDMLSGTVGSNLTLNDFSTGTYTVYAHSRATGFSSNDLANIISGVGAPAHVRDGLAEMWIHANQGRLVNSIKGIQGITDMTNDIHLDDGDVANLSGLNEISLRALNATAHLLGDHRSSLAAIMMGSKNRQVLENLEENAFIPASMTNLGFATYNGWVIIEDDRLENLASGDIGGTQVAGTDSTPVNTLDNSYLCAIMGGGAFQYADDQQIIHEEWDRNILAGQGAGETQLVTRRRQVLHPKGMDFNVNGNTDIFDNPTDAEIGTASSWSISAPRKQIPIAICKSNIYTV